MRADRMPAHPRLLVSLFVTAVSSSLFVSSAHGAAPQPPPPRETAGFCASVPGQLDFTDVEAASPHAANVRCLAALGIGQGRTATRFDPSGVVSRQEMASFLARLLDVANGYDVGRLADLPAYDGSPDFDDVDPASRHFTNIMRIGQVDVSRGRAERIFDPGGRVTRGQVAVFVMRSFRFLTSAPTASAPNYFTDDNGSFAESDINAAASLGIAVGDGRGRFGPADPVSRAQMASFIIRSLVALGPTARFVSPAGRDTSIGSRDAPWRTLGHAVTRAPIGSSVVLRAGEYRETVDVDRRLEIRSFPGETVWLVGSTVVSGWVAEGRTWRKDEWTHRFAGRAEAGLDIDPSHPLAGDPAMVFVDGAPLRQVGRLADVGPGSFFVDMERSRLYIGDNPNGRTIEAAVRPHALRIRAADTIVRGLGVRHYATHVREIAAVKAHADRVVIEESTFRHNAAAGVSAIGTGVRLTRNTAEANGHLGVHAFQADRLVLTDNRVVNNNRERFSTHTAGGVKISSSRDVEVRRNDVESNWGKGIWFDVSSWNATVVHNLAKGNSEAGIMYEVSGRGLIAGNASLENGRGILLLEASDVDIWNNSTIANGRNIEVMEGRRDAASGTGDGVFPLPYDSRRGYDSNIPWNTADIVIRNNILADGSVDTISLFAVVDVTDERTAEEMGVSTNFNAYWRPGADEPQWLFVWAARGTTRTFATLSEVQQSVQQERNSLSSAGGANPFANPTDPWHRAPSGSGAQGRGLALTARVAAALGIAATEPADIGPMAP